MRNRERHVRTWVFVDEMQLLFENDYAISYFDQLWTRSRKYGAIPTGITQNVERVINNEESRLMLANSDFLVLLGQSASDAAALGEVIKLSERQVAMMRTAGPGEGLLVAGGKIIPFENRIPTDSAIYRMVTTKLDDLIQYSNEDGRGDGARRGSVTRAMADEKPTVTDKASPLEMEKVKHSSLEYAVQHDGPAYRQRAVAPYKESALPELTRGEAARSVFKDRVSESVGNALGAAKGAAEGAARGAAKGAAEGRPAQPRAALEMSAAIGLSDGNAQIADEGARAADTVANAAMTQADPRNLYREGKAVADRLPAGRARRRMARWDAKSKKALAKQDKVLDQLEHKRKRADTMRRAGMSDKSLLGRWVNLRQKRLENKAGRLGAKAGRLAGTNTSGIRGKLMQLRRTKATVTNTVFGWRGVAAAGAAVGGTAVICLVGMSLLSAVIGGVATSSSGGSAEGYLAQAQRYVDDDSIGFSQSTRCHNPNMDCSSFVYYCLVDSGYCTTEQLGTYPFSTSTMAEPLLKAGFEKVEWDGKMDSLQRGDILINTEQHTEIYAGDGKDYGAHEDLDGADGDSSGDEVSLGSYWNDAWDTILRPTGGAGVTIPEQYGNGGYSVTFYTPRGCYVNGRDTAWAAGTSQAAVSSKWSLAGEKYDDDIATYNGRYLIACTTTYGRVGDKVDFTLSDGTVIKCVIADAKNPNDQGCNKWGHSNGQNVIEFEVERSRFYRSGNPGSSSWKAEWGGKRVCSSVNSGSIL